MRLLICLIGLLAMFGHSRAEETSYRTTTDQIVCNGVVATIKSTCSRSSQLKCRDQTMTLQRAQPPTGSRPLQTAVDIPNDRHVLLESWACVTSTLGNSYILLEYFCSFDPKACNEDEQKEEWQQLINLNGENLDSGHTLRGPGHEAVMEKAGLAHIMDHGLQLHAFGFMTGK